MGDKLNVIGAHYDKHFYSRLFPIHGVTFFSSQAILEQSCRPLPFF